MLFRSMRTKPPPATVLNIWGMQVSFKTSPSRSPCALTCATCLRTNDVDQRCAHDPSRTLAHTVTSADESDSAIMIAMSVRDAVWSSERARTRQYRDDSFKRQKTIAVQHFSNTFQHIQTGYNYKFKLMREFPQVKIFSHFGRCPMRCLATHTFC